MTRRASLLLSCALAAEPSAAADKKKTVELPAEHAHASGAFTFRTPAGWTVKPLKSRPELLEATGDGLKVWFYFRPQEIGVDALHVTCMEMRLLGPMETSLDIKYEHDFIGSSMGERKVLDSAFQLQYDNPVDGARDWRQRNVTIVGEGQSLCVSSHAPKARWRKSETRALLDAILGSVSFR
jgi:hypothetical protein